MSTKTANQSNTPRKHKTIVKYTCQMKTLGRWSLIGQCLTLIVHRLLVLPKIRRGSWRGLVCSIVISWERCKKRMFCKLRKIKMTSWSCNRINSDKLSKIHSLSRWLWRVNTAQTCFSTWLMILWILLSNKKWPSRLIDPTSIWSTPFLKHSKLSNFWQIRSKWD